MMALPTLPLDIAVPASVLCRRGGVTMTGIIIRNFLKESLRRNSGAMLDHSEQNALMLRVSEETQASSKADDDDDDDDDEEEEEEEEEEDVEILSPDNQLSELERFLLSQLDVTQYRPKHVGRFLTMHKRRRKRLVTRSLAQQPALLDDVLHGQVQCVLERVDNWQFNAFTLETVTGGRSLPVLCVHLFHEYGLLSHFDLDVVTVWKLFTLIDEGYHSTNPYHNSIHAVDVTQAMHCFLQEQQIRGNLNYLEIMASLIAAVTHDLDHPGVNQHFLVATSNHLAALYKNTSVLENHHWRSAVCCLLESGVAEQLPKEIKPELQRHISSLILATDITRQQEFLTRFKRYLDNRDLDMEVPDHRHFILQIALKCADISNPCRPWEISRKWSYKVCEEFFRQGDYERQLKLKLTPMCNRHDTTIPKIQVNFFKFVVLPLYEEWHRFLDNDFSRSLMQNFRSNEKQWELLVEQEDAADPTAAAAGSVAQPDSTASDNATENVEASELTEDSGSLELEVTSASLLVPAQRQTRDRRHSVPLGVSRSLSLAPKPTTGRRDSAPRSGATLLPPRIFYPRPSHYQSSPANITGLNSPERPVSAENLLPEPTIASIANSREASQLCSLVQQQPWESTLFDQPPAQRQGTLTRQQTFPPLQPFVRMRYMSTTAEMSQCCTEVLLEADSSSSRSCSPVPPATDSPIVDSLPLPPSVTTSASTGELRRHSTPAQSKSRCTASATGTGRRFTTIPLTQEPGQERQHKVFFIGSPPDSPPRLTSATPSSDSGSGSVHGEPRKSADNVSLPGNKRDYSETRGEKSSKMLKLMKENVDPRAAEDIKTSIAITNRRSKGWARRRGSEPVGLQVHLEDTCVPNRPVEPNSRRGSVPSDITAQPNGGPNRIGLSMRSADKQLGPSSKRRSSLPHETAIGNLLSNFTQLAADRENYPLNNNNNNNNNNTGSNNNGFTRSAMVEGSLATQVGTILSSHRGSLPADISEFRPDFGRNNGGKSRINRSSSKKLLRRRSSGGPEMFVTDGGNDENHPRSTASNNRQSVPPPTSIHSKRRGSLPIDMLGAVRYVHR
ncbi:uncharacterized protein LOC131670027 isoform X2 [Phymastichus coffea]|uniref:uncharacterized protein LOC131670027 isoform X2 n=1 Tax=Phymastichus coffea TaxID=108790 RepID=UPI00273B5215|nr:uncharacterized protein LOC131670027 isoform X2 [Phymastichus coffea]